VANASFARLRVTYGVKLALRQDVRYITLCEALPPRLYTSWHDGKNRYHFPLHGLMCLFHVQAQIIPAGYITLCFVLRRPVMLYCLT